MELSVFVWLLVCAFVILGGIAAYVQRFKEIPATRPFAILAWLVSLWALIYAFQLAVTPLPVKIFSAELLSFPQVLIPPVILALVLDYTGSSQWLNPRRWIILLIIPVITIFFSLTGSFHNLMGYHYIVDFSGPLPTLLFDRGPLYWCSFIYGCALIIICLWILIQSLRTPFIQVGSTLCIIIGILIPMVSFILFGLGISPIRGYDLTPSLFIVTGLLFLWALIHLQLFSTIPVSLSSVLENMSDPVLVLDNNGHVVHFNPAALELDGLRNVLAIGKKVSELPSYWLQGFAPYLETQATKEEVNITHTATQHWSYELTVSLITNPFKRVVGRIFLLHDITASKKVEEELRSSRQMLQSVLDNFPGMVFWKNSRSAYMGYNKTFAISTNAESADLIGKTDYELGYPLVVADKYHAEDVQVMQSGRPILGSVSRHYDRDGVLRWLSTSKVPLSDDQGNIVGIIGIVQDITQQKQAEEDVHQLNASLEKRVKERTRQLDMLNKELASISYTIAHDLKTPLRAMDGFSHILLEEYRHQLDPEGQNYLDRISNATRQMGRLSDDLLKLLSITRSMLTPKQVDLIEFAEKIIAGLQASSPKRKIVFIHPPTLVVNGDGDLLNLLLESLLNNAWKFTQKQKLAEIELGCTEEDGNSVYFVRDNGVGFDMEYADKLFGIFQRLHTRTDFEGTGIGLALAQRVIYRHGGTIWAKSTPAVGATFYFTLPQVELPDEPAAAI